MSSSPPPSLQLPVRIPLLLALVVVALAQSNLNNGFNHRAHAVPGGPYAVADLLQNSRARVTLSGELSHSHYLNPRTGATGRIVSYVWRIDGRRICSAKKCTVFFNLGRTTVSLTVTDNTGDTSTASTTVTVYPATRPSIRIWFYPGLPWAPDERVPPPAIRPSFSRTVSQLKMRARSDFPEFLLPDPFSARVLGNIEFYQAGMYRFRLLCEGAHCGLRIGGRNLVAGALPELITPVTFFNKGFQRLDVFYRRARPERMQMSFALFWRTPMSTSWTPVPANRLYHIPEAYLPVLHTVEPRRAPVGTRITISGSSLVKVRSIQVGTSRCENPVFVNQFTLTCIIPGGSGERLIRVINEVGASNTLPFLTASFSDLDGPSNGPIGYYHPIGFQKEELKSRDGSTFEIAQPTSITLGPDGRYYLGSLNGFVHALTVGLDYVVSDHCQSPKVGPQRSVLGVAFNPAEGGAIKLYASASTMSWLSREIFPFEQGWHNGEIIVLKPTSKACLEKVDTIITGLPVSNFDHSVNSLSFDQQGNMLISVAGSTNAGVADDRLGGIPDSPLSGAILIAPVSKKGFNGHVRYSQLENPEKAYQVSGQVRIFASGFRNSYDHVLHSSGALYATDNGANTGFGPKSTSCNSEDVAFTELDALFLVRRYSYHGYANRNRGRYDKKQCAHKGRVFVRPLTQLESSTNGIIEYTANTFGAQMRGDLLATKFAVRGQGTTYRIQLKKSGKVKSKSELIGCSGLTAALAPNGAVVMPRVSQSKVVVLHPTEVNPRILVVTSVNPFRGPRRGGNRITISGWNLDAPLTVTVGGKPCVKVSDFRNGRSIQCTAPAGRGRAAVVVSRYGESSRSYGFEYWYMNV